MKEMLIITGPQGSGNHLFSKVFALHENVYGWKDLLTQYWIAHDDEPFAKCWNDPNLLYSVDWSKHNYYVTSISCPYANKGVVTIPKYKEFIEILQELNIKIKIGIIGRDQNVIKYQQERVRDRYSYPDFKTELEYLNTFEPVYLSHELLYLYKDKYLKSLNKQLDFPVQYDDIRVHEILKEDANKKYFNSVEHQDLDSLVRKVSGLKDTL